MRWHIFQNKGASVLLQKKYFRAFLYRCFYPHCSKYSVCPVCGIFNLIISTLAKMILSLPQFTFIYEKLFWYKTNYIRMIFSLYKFRSSFWLDIIWPYNNNHSKKMSNILLEILSSYKMVVLHWVHLKPLICSTNCKVKNCHHKICCTKCWATNMELNLLAQIVQNKIFSTE